jgi:hypothetical protein
MKTDCSEQFSLDFHPDKEVRAQFDGGRITTDAGLIPLRQHESDQNFYQRLSRTLNDPRQQSKVEHLQPDILRQRGLGIVAGYEDATDSDRLRSDPAFIVMNGQSDLQDDRGPSQSTVTRMENEVTPRSVVKLNRWLLSDWIRRKQEPPEQITLEIDATDDPTHGNQQLSMFDGFYGQHMYFPLLIFDGESGDGLAARLRKGSAPGKARAVPQLKRIITRIQEEFPQADPVIRLRADAGFMEPALYRMLEQRDIQYTINLTKNDVLKRETEQLFKQVQDTYEEGDTEQKVTRYTEFTYQAASWEDPRRVCAKLEYGPQGANRRFVVTNTSGGTAEETFSFYEERGQCENYIKELKNGFSGDRLSCTDFVANAFRFLEHVLAYNLVNQFRNSCLNETELQKADIHTLRTKLFKVAARIKTTVRNVWVQLSESWPFRDHLLAVGDGL